MRTLPIITVLAILLNSCDISPKESLTIINVDDSYPTKEVALQDLWMVDYIPLETDSVFLVPSSAPAYISKDYIGFINGASGDIMFWSSQTGKKAFRINRKGAGPEEYKAVGAVTYDDKKNEVYTWSIWDNTIQIYNTRGDYYRTLSLHNYIKGDFNAVTSLVNANDSLLICSVNNMKGYTLHYYLNKKTGNTNLIDSIPKEKAVSIYVQENIDGVPYSIAPIIKPIVKDGNHYVYSEQSIDTIFNVMGEEKVPNVVRIPSVKSTKPVKILRYHYSTDDWQFLSTVQLSYDFRKKDGLYTQYYGIEKESNKVYEMKFYNKDFINGNNDFPNQYCNYIKPGILLDALENNKLHGKLKEIAQSIDGEDNGVLMILGAR